ncbi:hypothetical protein QTO34_012298 [Cnephaeus nilssonii]|uniref:Transforming acidic coiled-coil-containing protein C-terminal domain-containing protein n=1 Tax=Cnephaeus nilssonii TaxID=3371016 RepID=A0AA40LEL8_CNENI|nr:hypothetical protein QTO34_012298 [Eptesicus nilssonii]
MDLYESLLYRVMEEAQKQEERAKAEIQKVRKEKDELSTGLSSMEKSFSDLLKRQKAVIEGYRTVGGLCPVTRLVIPSPQPLGQELPSPPSPGPLNAAPGEALLCAGLCSQSHQWARGRGAEEVWEDYTDRVQKEGQRYQALKAHAEEKLRL